MDKAGHGSFWSAVSRLQTRLNSDICVSNEVGGGLAPLCARVCAQRSAQRRLIGSGWSNQFLNLSDGSASHLHGEIRIRLAREIAHLECAGNFATEYLSANSGNTGIAIGKHIVSIDSDDVRKCLLIWNCQS